MTRDALAPPAAVTVIGLGNMGVPMAARLVEAGFDVTGYDRAATALSNFSAANGRTAETLAAAVSAADAVILLLPDGKIVREVLNEAVPHLRHRTLIIDMGSSDPIGTRDLGAELIAAGFEFVDAPGLRGRQARHESGRSPSWREARRKASTASNRFLGRWAVRSSAPARSAPVTR